MDIKPPLPRWERTSAPPEDWRNLMRASKHEDEVVALVRDHMALWSPHEIARLPGECRPGRVRDAEDINRWAYELASAHCAQVVPPDDEPLLDRLLEFVTQAAIRLCELQAEPVREHEAS